MSEKGEKRRSKKIGGSREEKRQDFRGCGFKAVQPVPGRAGKMVSARILAFQARLRVPWAGSGCENERAARYLTATGGPTRLYPRGCGFKAV